MSEYPVILPEEEINIMVKEKAELAKNEDRLEKMKREQALLQKDLEKYIRIRKSWNTADVAIKMTGTVLVFISTSAAIVFGTVGSLGILTPVVSGVGAAVLSSVTLFKTTFMEIFSVGYTSKRKHMFQERVDLVKEFINKFYFYFEKAREDNIISLDEIKNFNKLLDEYNNKMLELKLKQKKGSGNVLADAGVAGNFTMLKDKDIKKVEKKIIKNLKEEQLKNFYAEKVKTMNANGVP